MRAQAQITIHSLYDAEPSKTAPANPTLGQLWVDTSKNPPVTMVWNGSAWKEQNGTDTIRTTIKTIETKEANLETNLNGLTSTVSSVTKRVEVVEDGLGEAQETILDIQTDVSELEQTASSIALRVTANEENISELEVTADGLATRVSSAEGKVTTLTTTVNGLKTRVTNAEGDISAIEQDVSSITTRVTNAEGDIASIETSVSGITTRVSNAEGDISSLEQSVSSITTRVTSAEGNISDLTTDLSGITARVTSAEGNITTLTTTVNGLKTRVTTAEGNISTLEQTVDGISSQVETNRGNISSLTQTVNSISTQVSTNTGNISTLTQTVDAVEVQVSTNKGNIATLTTSVNGIKTRMTNAEGDITALEQDLDSITTRVETAEGDISTIEQNVSSVTTRVSNAEGNIATLTTSVNSIKTRMTNAEGDISTLEQTTEEIAAEVEAKVDEEGGATTSFGWKLTTSGFYLYSNSTTVMSVTSSGLSVRGTITASSGTIGGFTIGSSSIYKTKTAYNNTTAGVYLGTNGIGLGAGTFYVTSAGALYASNATITGSITATSGSLSNLNILGSIYFGDMNEYFLNPNENNGSWYIYLPKFRVDDTSAYFEGTLSAPTGNIGGFTIGTSSIYKTKTAYSNTTAGVYVGTDGIGLGAGTFYVTSAGAITAKSGSIGAWSITSSAIGTTQTGGSFYLASASDTASYWIRAHNAASGGGTRTFSVSKTGVLYATGADIAGKITATSGSVENLTITGKLTFGGNSTYYINANYNDNSWYLKLPGVSSDEASGTVFSGRLSAPSGSIGGFTIGSSSIYKTKTSYSSSTAGVYIGTDGIGLGAGTFYVTSAGALYATSATITGTFSNKKSSGLGLEISGSTVSFYNGSTKIGHITGGTGYIPWNNSSSTVSGIAVSSLLCADGGVRVGKSLQLSTGNGIYVSNKLALTMGQIKVQTATLTSRYLLFYCGLLVGIGSSAFSGISDYSSSTYSG